MGINVLVLLLEFTFIQGISAELSLVQAMKAVSVREGESITLPCRFTGDSVECLWTRGGSVIYPKLFQGTYVMSGDMKRGDCSLRIVKANFTDDNTLWWCQVPPSVNFRGTQSPPARLTVLIPPEKPFFRIGPDKLKVEDGGLVSVDADVMTAVTCVSRNGSPASNLWLYLGDEKMTNTETTINKSAGLMTVNETGTYEFTNRKQSWRVRCVVQNQAYNGTNVEAVVYINVNKGADIGVACGTVIIAAVCMALIVFICYRRRKLCFTVTEFTERAKKKQEIEEESQEMAIYAEVEYWRSNYEGNDPRTAICEFAEDNCLEKKASGTEVAPAIPPPPLPVYVDMNIPSRIKSPEINHVIKHYPTDEMSSHSTTNTRHQPDQKRLSKAQYLIPLADIPDSCNDIKSMGCSCRQNSTKVLSLLKELRGEMKEFKEAQRLTPQLYSELASTSGQKFFLSETVLTPISRQKVLRAPLNTIDELEKLEINVSNPNFSSRLHKDLSLVGGKNVKDRTKRVMKALMTDGVAMKLNWTGNFEMNNPFKNMKLKGIVVDAVRGSKNLLDADLSEIEMYIQNWLSKRQTVNSCKGTFR